MSVQTAIQSMLIMSGLAAVISLFVGCMIKLVYVVVHAAQTRGDKKS